MTFITQSLSDVQKAKIYNDLVIIDRITTIGKQMGIRVVIGGGYAVDGALGQITRSHDDIDIQFYSKNELTMDEVAKFLARSVQDKGREEYYHVFRVEDGDFIADIYALCVDSDPFGNEKIIMKRDGSKSEVQKFATKIVILDGVSFEAQDASVELEDKLYKRNIRHDPVYQKHDQDIVNLQKLLAK